MPLPFLIKKQIMRNTQTKKPNKVTIMSVLANGNTGGACGILQEYGYPKPKNHADLEFKLAQLYRNSSEKRDLERKFAEVHPHKDLILKYCSPRPEFQEKVTEPTVESPIVSESMKTDIIVEAPVVAEKPTTLPESKSNCSGTACNCDCKSNADGGIPSLFTNQVKEHMPDKTLIYGFFGIIGLLIIVHHLKK